MATATATTTTSTPTAKTSASNLSSLFSWNKSRQVTPLNCFLETDEASPRKPEVEYELKPTPVEAENAHLLYTSLRDLIPGPGSRPGSPVKPKRTLQEGSGGEEEVTWSGSGSDRPPIKNRLVEQAARAYLLPTSPQKTPLDQFFARYWAKLTSNSNSDSLLALPPGHGCIHGCTHGCLSCLPSLIWVDLTRVVHGLFSQLKQPPLLRDHPHGSTVIMSSSHAVSRQVNPRGGETQHISSS